MQLNETRALVTGGVSGLGFAVARRLVAGGAPSSR
jgi:NAD(P)-dependent dehydrogenase (short-subunit alcohol dehydrogenase family)